MSYLSLTNITSNSKRAVLSLYHKLKQLAHRFHFFLKYHFIPIQANKIIFQSYFGTRYNDSPRQISEELQRRNLGLDIVWAFTYMGENVPEGIRTVKYGTPEYMQELASAKVWVNNIRNWDCPPKKRKQIYLQTWHSSFAVKAVEKDAEDQLKPKYVAGAKRDGKMTTAILSSNQQQTDRFKRSFWLNRRAEILEFGTPRNDLLLHLKNCPEEIIRLKKELTDAGNTVILYAPTFRDDHSLDGYRIDFERVLDAFVKRTGTPCVLLLRMHPNVMKQGSAVAIESERIINCSYYPNGEALCAISDYLITDYSGILYNFVLLEKPVFLCALDLEHYNSLRRLMPLYYELPFPFSTSSSALVREIEQFDPEKYMGQVASYFRHYPIYDTGNATSKAADWIMSKMQQ